MSLYSDLKDGGYLQFYGCVSNKQDAPCSNYFLFTAIACMIAREESDMASHGTLYGNAIRTLHLCRDTSSTIRRNPHSSALCSHAEYIGIASLSPTESNTIYNNMSCLGPWPRFCFYRFFYFYPFVKIASGRRPKNIDIKIFRAAGWIAGLSKKSNTSSKVLFILMCNKIREDVPKTIKNKYSGPKEIYSIYFGKEHPITIHARSSW